MSGKFPRIKFGICPVCGGGGDLDQDASGADAAPDRTAATDRQAAATAAGVTISDANGYPLKWFDGRLMCDLCIKEEKAREESIVDSGKQVEAEQFRARAGFSRGIT